MGYGSYQSKDWDKLRSNRNITSRSTVSDLYKSREMQSWLNPYRVAYRESMDSMDNPASTAIIIGLHVTQFEADIRIAEQLLDVYFEGRGGGNGGESYLLSWYFASRHTKIDCYDKRKKKGFLFTIGDECCHADLTAEEIDRVFGEKSKDCMAVDLYREASEKYEIFHIVMKAGSYKHQRSGENWKELIGNRAIELDPEDLDILPELLVGLMQRVNGMSVDEVVGQGSGKASGVVKKILVEAGDFVSEKKKFLSF